MVANRSAGQPKQPGNGQPVASPVPAELQVTTSALPKQTREAGPTGVPAMMIQLTVRPDRVTTQRHMELPRPAQHSRRKHAGSPNRSG
jgi:hypothetical protein